MGKQEFDNLVKIGTLKAEPASRKEFDGMVKSARRGLADAQNESIETDSQFHLAVEAAHKFALACYGVRAIDLKIGSQNSRRSFTLWELTTLTSKSS
jgi:hypothetical protein